MKKHEINNPKRKARNAMQLNYYRLLFEPCATLAVIMLAMSPPKIPRIFKKLRKPGRK